MRFPGHLVFFFPLIALMVGLASCRGELNEGQNGHAAKSANQSTTPSNTELGTFSNFFPDSVMQSTRRIKAAFENGLRDYAGPERPLSYLYEQNARALRMHFLAEETFRFVFPFNGKMSLEELATDTDRLPFVTRNCAFVVDSVTYHYYCPSLDSMFFAYLASVEPPSPLISNFVETYRSQRTITPAIRQQMLLSGLEELDFEQPDHQLFYALFQFWVYSEMRAYVVANAADGAVESATESTAGG